MAKNTPILETIRNLLDIAEHPNTNEHEREAAYKRANNLMTKHAIDEVILNASRTQSERETPTSTIIKAGSESYGEFWPAMRTILAGAAQANRCRVVQDQYHEVQVFGFAEDVAWVEMLYTSIYFTFMSQINPKWDESKTYDENIYTFKVGGYKWYDINVEAMKHGHPDMRRDKTEERYHYGTGWIETVVKDNKLFKGAIVTAYKRHAKKIGDTNIVSTQNHEAYRRQFTDGFRNAMMRRFEKMRYENDEQYKGSGMELAIVDREKEVDEHIWNLFPDLHPDVRAAKDLEWRQKAQEERQKEEAERQALLDGMTDKQRYEFLAKEERKREREAASNRRYWEREEAKNRDYSGQMRGRSAAQKVNLSKAKSAEGTKSKGELN